MKHEILPDLLKKYLRGEATPEESVLIDEWYSSLQENPDDISLLDPLEQNIAENRILKKIKRNISHQIPSEIKHSRTSSKFYFLRTPFKLAAAIAAIAVIGLGAILFKEKGLPSLQNQTVAKTSTIKKLSNETSEVKKVQLEDGTIINLQPNSSVEFPERFSASERTVVLRGEAFFDVAKEKNRPFLISASDVTVKVLGTSFNVMAYDGAQEISVAVKTGKVSVSAKAKTKIPHQKRKEEEVILTPNQEAVYNTTEESFSKKLVDQPQIVLEKPTLFETQYDGAPVVKILDVLEKNYGIDIEFNEEALANCILTTSMAEEGLYERIEIICKAIGAQYQINDTNIVIESSGCH
jgi:ferric-dicitrate binding protein FerR (iron transport regulator)